jgi:FkbM family methyltransferase
MMVCRGFKLSGRILAVATMMNTLLKRFDLSVVRHSKLERLKGHLGAIREKDIELIINVSYEHVPDIIKYLRQSHAQARQDLFVLSQLNFKRNGFFVEFGATNGVDHSNTHLLEKEFGWTGILAEPAIRWHDELRNNRKAAIETQCVWKESKLTLTFNETDTADLSTIDAYSGADAHRNKRIHGKKYEVRTISLNDLLEKHKAPQHIDYLSIDTEGSELEILQGFDFNRHSFGVITCEHNFTPLREKIHSLLSREGYVRKFNNVSQQDDWYVKVE